MAGLRKKFGHVVAVQDVSFTVAYGRITGFLGPNGAGKTTTLRMLLGLIRPDAGTAAIAGRPYPDLASPARTVGALLDAAAHPGRSGRDHLRVLAAAAGIPRERASQLLATVGLQHAARQRAGGYSLGMRQRLGLAAALLGDPAVLVLDEPANGLDPQGIRWLRDLLRSLAAEGRAVLVSSHILAEVAQTADDVHGHILDELQELTVSPDETDDLLRLGLHRLPPGDFPLLRGLAPVLAGYDGAAELERGLDILLTGLTTTLTPPGQTRPPAPAQHPASLPAFSPDAGRTTPRRGDRARTRL